MRLGSNANANANAQRSSVPAKVVCFDVFCITLCIFLLRICCTFPEGICFYFLYQIPCWAGLDLK